MWHVKKLIKQHSHYADTPCAGDNKRPLCLQCPFREFGSTSNRPHNCRPRVTMPDQDLHLASPAGSAETSRCMTAYSNSSQYPATSHSRLRVGQHSLGHNQQPDQLYAKEMSRCMRHSGHTMLHAPTFFLFLNVLYL